MGDESSPTNPSVPGDSFVILSRNFITYKSHSKTMVMKCLCLFEVIFYISTIVNHHF